MLCIYVVKGHGLADEVLKGLDIERVAEQSVHILRAVVETGQLDKFQNCSNGPISFAGVPQVRDNRVDATVRDKHVTLAVDHEAGHPIMVEAEVRELPRTYSASINNGNVSRAAFRLHGRWYEFAERHHERAGLLIAQLANKIVARMLDEKY